MPDSTEERFEVHDLPRGGQVVVWGDFVAQLGVYPETIKDSMETAHGVPGVYILPHRLFDIGLGVSRAEIEFPVYFNFYLHNRKTRIVCQPWQLRPVMRVLREAIFGPSKVQVENDYPQGAEVADLMGEMRYFKVDEKRAGGLLRIRDLVEFHLFDEEGTTRLGEVTVASLGADRYLFRRAGKSREVTFRPPPKLPPVPPSTRRYRPPFFGVTVIGSGHGFDPYSDTSGFVIWINGRGVLVDPPVDTTRWMKNNGVDSRLIEDLVLTHCHADHDAGTLQKMLEEGRVRLHTTSTVIDSFLRKYRGLLGLTETQLRALFDFCPVTVNEPMSIAGGRFRFRYNFHPIPTLGFDVTFQGRTVAYSGDHLNDRDMLTELHHDGLLSKRRLEELLDFRWDADLILHEAGIPPIHTPVETLVSQPDDVKQRLYVNHISADKVPTDAGLKLAPPGVAQTLLIDVEPPELWVAQRMLDLFSGVDLFWTLSISKIADFLRIARYQKYSAGEVLVRTGDPGNQFFLILSGEAEVVQKGEFLTRLGRHDYFGEVAVLLGSRRTADIRAYTEMEVLTVDSIDFLRFIHGTELARTLRLVAESRLHEGWPLLNENALLAKLSVKQKTQLIPFMRKRSVPAGRLLYRRGDRVRCIYLLQSGEVCLESVDQEPVRAYRGALVGRITSGLKVRHTVNARTESPLQVYVVGMRDLETFFQGNPGTYVRFVAAARGANTEIL